MEGVLRKLEIWCVSQGRPSSGHDWGGYPAGVLAQFAADRKPAEI